MARKLPWLSESKPKRPIPKEGSPAPKRRKILASSEDEDATKARAGTHARERTSKWKVSLTEAGRNPSSSPPPAPPTPEYMKEGFDQDDMWVMVEDEFLETAKQFTRHLHHAEYQRLKRLAKEKKAGRAEDIARPVVGQATMSVAEQKRVESEKLEREQRRALRAAAGKDEDSDEWEDQTWASNPRLAGLMSRKESTNLTKLMDSQSQTRVDESQHREKTSGMRDPDPPSSPPELPSSPPPVARKSRVPSTSSHPATDLSQSKSDARLEFAQRQRRLEARRQKQEEEKKRKSVLLDEIPTFLV